MNKIIKFSSNGDYVEIRELDFEHFHILTGEEGEDKHGCGVTFSKEEMITFFNSAMSFIKGR